MGFFKGFFQVLTCGIGLCLWRRIKKRIGFSKWTLRWQIFCSVSCSLFCVLVILVAVILVSAVCVSMWKGQLVVSRPIDSRQTERSNRQPL